MAPNHTKNGNSEEVPKSDALVFFVNGRKITEVNPNPEQLLVDYLREKLHLTGTKIGCSEGGCGACTVMLSKIDRSSGKVSHRAVVACLTPLCSVHGAAITTVEGIGNVRDKLHPVQERIAKAHGSQCGFCTPGIVMSMYALLRNNPQPSMEDLEKTFQGNLCRCTGYRPILEGYRTFTKDGSQNGCPMGDKCCKFTGVKVETKLFEESELQPYNPTQEVIFPPELKVNYILNQNLVVFRGSRVTWYRPTTLDELLGLKQQFPEARIVNGNTEVGLETKTKLCPVLISAEKVPQLQLIEREADGIRFGASVTLTEMEEFLRVEVSNKPESETRVYKAILDMLHWFSGAQIRNVATAVGNIMTASPISDLNPIFLVSGVELEIASKSVQGRTKMCSGFFTGYRKTIIRPDEVVTSIFIPKSLPNQYVLAFKQAKRRDDDITIVNMALNVILDSNKVSELSVAYGGVAPQIVLPLEGATFVKGAEWNEALFEKVKNHLDSSIKLSIDSPGGEAEYRKSLVLSLFFKAFLTILEKLGQTVSDRERSILEPFKALELKSTQLFEKASEQQPSTDPIGRPTVANSAYKQASGEAIYVDDMPRFDNELFVGLVLSSKAHAKIKSIDASAALKIPGVVDFHCAKDIPAGKNQFGIALQDEFIFADGVVTSEGQIIGAVLAEDRKLAREAANLVVVEYEDLPVILVLEEAIEKESFYPNYPVKLERGDVNKAFKESYATLEGTFRTGKQDHFYIEPHSCVVVPRDSDELEIFSATQWLKWIQQRAAALTDLPESKISARVKRVGGGFGGKEVRPILIAFPTVFAAHKLRRPVRCTLERDQDMKLTGTRNALLFKYKVSFTKEGVITGMHMRTWVNAGHTMDCSCFVLERAMMHVQNAYNIPNIKCEGWVCRTNTVSNTVFRGSGSPQAIMAAEQAIRDVARALGKDYTEIMALNLYKEGDVTHYSQAILNCNVERCFKECIENSQFHARKAEVEQFNAQNRWKKRGIAVYPTVFGAGYTAKFLNQAGALVHIYTDGSVLLTHGGVEIGQGLHIKMIQIASRVLEIPVEMIHTAESATDKVPNSTSSSASVSADLNGPAVMAACQVLKERLAPYKEQYPEEGWTAWVNRAYMDRVQLSSQGFYIQPDIGHDWDKNEGNAWFYFVFGAGCAEVEIDCLTGDHQVRRVDIVMDVGSSLNPAIDIGQIEGAFVQGYGLFTMEEVLYSPDGRLLTKGPSNYKVPGFNDIPGEINVALLTGAPNPRAVYSSKAVGEPPLHLSGTVFFAIKEAVAAARAEEGLKDNFEFFSPATAARIRMACQNKFTVTVDKAPGAKPWSLQI